MSRLRDEEAALTLQVAKCKIDFNVLIEQGTPDGKKQFIRTYIDSIEVDGKDRKITVGYYDPGEEVALKVMPPRGIDTKGSGACSRKSKVLRLFIRSGDTLPPQRRPDEAC